MIFMYFYIIRNKNQTTPVNEEDHEMLIAVFNDETVDENKRNPL